MIELQDDELVFSFPEVHPEARVSVNFQRTLRIPDDNLAYPLPPGLGRFPMCHVDDFSRKLPSKWIERGGVMLPMFQAEALWIAFEGHYLEQREATYPFALKIATGKINAVSGAGWKTGLHRGPQDYVVIPDQPWLDGYCVKKGVIRQFVAMPLGQGYTAEEQITGEAEYGGLQIMAVPMRRSVFEKRFPVKTPRDTYCLTRFMSPPRFCDMPSSGVREMGLAPGGRMRQEIYEDKFLISDWDLEHASRCFIHICNSETWRAITGEPPPTQPLTAEQYTRAGMPWFDYYSESPAVAGSKKLAGLKSVAAMGAKKRKQPLPKNETVKVDRVIHLQSNRAGEQVRESGKW